MVFLGRLTRWFKKYFWLKIYVPPLIPEKEEITVTFKFPLELFNAVTRKEVTIKAGAYLLLKKANPMIKDGEGWLVLEGSRIGAVESWWEDRVRSGQVVIED